MGGKKKYINIFGSFN